MMEGCCHTRDQQVSEEHFPCTQSCQQVSGTNFHLLRPGCAPYPPAPPRAFFGQAISASWSSSPTSSATPSWVITPHLPPCFLPSSSKGHLANPSASARVVLRCVPLAFPPFHLEVWLRCPPSPAARSPRFLRALSTPRRLRPPLAPTPGSPAWPSPWTSRSLLTAWAPERSSEASRARSARPRRGSHSCAMTCCPHRAPGLEPPAVGGWGWGLASRCGEKPTAAHAHGRPASSGARVGLRGARVPGSPFFWLLARATP